MEAAVLCDLHERGTKKRELCRSVFVEPAVAGDDVPAIVARLRAASLSDADDFELSGRGPDADARLNERLRRTDRAWLTYVFEAAFLSAWWLFVAMPWIRGASFARLVIHAAAAPFLLFIPFFLGYAPMTFTFGPSGGILYPLYLVLASIPMSAVPCSQLDIAVWPHLPHVLGWFTQLPGAPMAATNFACVGPASSLGFGLLVAWVLVAGRFTVAGGRRLLDHIRS